MLMSAPRLATRRGWPTNWPRVGSMARAKILRTSYTRVWCRSTSCRRRSRSRTSCSGPLSTRCARRNPAPSAWLLRASTLTRVWGAVDMTPIEFVLWLNGAAELVGDQPPTPEQWATMREKLGEVVGGLVAARLLERAEEYAKADERRKNLEVPEAPEPYRPPELLTRIFIKDTT